MAAPVVCLCRSCEPTPDLLTLDLVLPAGTGEITWRLTLEDASERTGRIAFGELELIETRSVDGTLLERRRLLLEAGLPWGYHHLAIEPGDATMMLVVTPGKCWLPPALVEGRRLWGIAAQLYLLRSGSDWGIGDFGDLRRLVELAADRGADVIGLNPLHAMFPDDPEHASPYSPASRLLLNILNIDVTAIPELLDCPETRELIASEAFGQGVQACRSKHLVDYAGVTAIKLSVLERLFDACRGSADPARWRAFEAFRREHGDVLERNCLFLALREHFAHEDPSHADWHAWPEEYRDPASPAVARFAEENRHRLDFFAWQQWVADEQLAAAAAAAEERGMAVGLYRDLAVGADRAGAETWANAAAVVSGAQVGAPPDIYNPAGQNWGLPPFHPRALREEGYRSFIELVRANMRHAGGLRIDHAMGLQHLYWVPQGQKPSAGAYVRYPIEDLIGILALESHRHRCLVVGRGPRHRAGGLPRAHGGGEYPFLPRAVFRAGAGDRRLPAAERLPGTGPGRRRQPRPADLARLVGRTRPRSEGTARPIPGAWRSLAPASDARTRPDAASGGAPPREAVVRQRRARYPDLGPGGACLSRAYPVCSGDGANRRPHRRG